MKSKGHWSRLTRGWVSTIQCMYHSVAWTVQATCGQATLWHLTSNVLTVVLMRIQVLQVVKAVFSAWLVPSTLKVTGTSKTTGTAYTVEQHHHPRIFTFSLCHLLWAHWDMFPQKWYQELKRVPQQHSSPLKMSASLKIAQGCDILQLVSFTASTMNVSINNPDT